MFISMIKILMPLSGQQARSAGASGPNVSLRLLHSPLTALRLGAHAQVPATDMTPGLADGAPS